MVDAQNGDVVQQIRVVPDCTDSLGLFADSAISDGVVFVNGANCIIPAKPPFVPPTGVVAALKSDDDSKDGLKKLWEFTSLFAPVLSGVAVANGVVTRTARAFMARCMPLTPKQAGYWLGY